MTTMTRRGKMRCSDGALGAAISGGRGTHAVDFRRIDPNFPHVFRAYRCAVRKYEQLKNKRKNVAMTFCLQTMPYTYIRIHIYISLRRPFSARGLSSPVVAHRTRILIPHNRIRNASTKNVHTHTLSSSSRSRRT